MNTVGKAWMVCRQHYNRGERFRSEDEAKQYAEELARRFCGESVEIFSCAANVAAAIPIVVTTEPEGVAT
jgi:hypothetical protein